MSEAVMDMTGPFCRVAKEAWPPRPEWVAGARFWSEE